MVERMGCCMSGGRLQSGGRWRRGVAEAPVQRPVQAVAPDQEPSDVHVKLHGAPPACAGLPTWERPGGHGLLLVVPELLRIASNEWRSGLTAEYDHRGSGHAARVPRLPPECDAWRAARSRSQLATVMYHCTLL